MNQSSLGTFRRRALPNCDLLVTLVLLVTGLVSENVWADPASPQAGYQFLTEKAYLPPDFDQQTLDAVWEVWPEPLKSQARESSLLERRRMIFNRYGLTPRPDSPPTDESLKPLQYVVSPQGEWSMNCFACHGGRVGNQVVPGAPNSDFALAMLTADIRQTKLRLGKRLGHMDVGSLFMPLGTTRGSTNAVMFGVALLAYRDDDLNLLPKRFPPPMVHHDMDAPPWWHFQRKQALYIDGFAPKSHRPLMQFMLVEQNGPEKFAEWESDFRDVQAYISSIQPPRYPFPINEESAAQGRVVFANHCAECHGTYGAGAHYPERMVAWDEVRTDRVRLQALSPAARARYGRSWFAVGHSAGVIADPPGYVAPPLDGLWASAPYLHNGSVPTLWHLLRPEQRPDRWRKSGSQIDPEHVGLTIDTDSPVEPIQDPVERHAWFDTRRYGKSATGHDFPAKLTEEEKSVLLEYLKTL